MTVKFSRLPPKNIKAARIVKASSNKASPEFLATHHALVSVATGTFAEVISEASLSYLRRSFSGWFL